MQEVIDAYFKKCDNAVEWVMTKEGPQQLPSPDPYTIEGLADALDLTRHGLLHYEKDSNYKEFFTTVLRAKQKVQANLVTGGVKGRFNANSTNFNLKNNFGYKDQQEVAVTDKVFNVEF